jgi:HSP20 family protein
MRPRNRYYRNLAPYWDSRVAMPMDIEEQENSFVVKASVPGYTTDEIDITVKDGILFIRAEREEEEEQEREGWHLRERFTGSVERHLHLGEDIDGENIEAELTHGVLTLTLPKVEESKPKMIEVKAS